MEVRLTPKRLLCVVLVSALFAGCDGGPGETDDDTGTPPTDTSADTAAPDTMDTGTTDTADTVADTGRDAADGGGDADTADGGQQCLECENCVACKYQSAEERSCQLQGDRRPPRCDVDPTAVEGWGPGGVMTRLEFTSNAAQDCCFNIDGSPNGSVDNKVGQLVASLPIDVDRQIKFGLLYEDFAALAEFDGLEAFDQTESFDANVYLGRFTSPESADYVEKANADCDLENTDCELEGHSGRAFRVSPETLDDGAHAQAHFPDATIEDNRIKAGPGRITLDITLENLGRFEFDVRGATVEADVDTAASDLEGDGIVIREGRIGGYVLMKDIVGQINHLLEPCNCLENPESAVVYPNDDPDDPDLRPNGCVNGTKPAEECQIECTDKVQMLAERCGRGTGLVCEQTTELCPVVSLLKNLPDLDTDGDGQNDAISAGALFETTGADIVGISDYVRGSDQKLTSGSRAVLDQVFANETGWLAIYEDRSFEQDALLGHKKVEPGHYRDFEVGVSQPKFEQRVWAVLHRDDGPETGTFEAAGDSKVKWYPEARKFVQSSFWVQPPDD